MQDSPPLESALEPLMQRYARELAAKGYEGDVAQRRAVERLDVLRTRVLAEARLASWRRLAARWRRGVRLGDDPRGAYLWGAVGRGKTWLMDLFYDSLGSLPRRRVHFHRFMRDVHALLRELPSQRSPLEAVARRLASQARLLCLDELHVADIADAMILGGLFESLLREGMWLVTTSNLPPHELYRDGLQRSRFLPAIELLERRLEVIAVDGGIDYRLRTLQRQPIYLDSAAPDTPARLQSLFEQLSGEHADSDAELHLQGRRLRARRRRGDVVWFTFATLCEGPRSQLDYAELAQQFHTVVLSEVPRFTRAQQDNAARRFIALIDVLYDQAVKLIVSAAAPPQQLYQGERLAFDFRRTASRLVEMQSEAYLARPHRA
jgi:cell division protein ZapE